MSVQTMQVPRVLTGAYKYLQTEFATYKLNLPNKALQVLIIFVSQSLQLYNSNTKLVKMHMSSYKSLSFFQVSNTGWFHTFDFLNFEIVQAWVEMMSEADDAFLHVHLGHVQLKSQLQDYTITSWSPVWLQNLNCART